MNEMKSKLSEMLKEKNLFEYVVDSFDTARNNDRRKNAVILEDGIYPTIYITFKVDTETEKNIFGELVSWNEDEFKEDNSLYDTAVNAVSKLFSYTDEALNQHILNNDLPVTFMRYDEPKDDDTDEPGEAVEALLEAIDMGLSNRYVVLEGDHETLYVKDRETEEHLSIHVERCID